MERLVEAVRVTAAKHHGQVVAVRPVSFLPELHRHPLVEFRSRQGIGNRDADVVRRGFLHQLNGLPDVLPVFTRIAELQEKAGPDAVPAQILAGLVDLLHLNPFFHGVQDLLRTRFRAHPYFDAPGALERGDGGPSHEVAPGLHLERDLRSQLSDGIGKLLCPRG